MIGSPVYLDSKPLIYEDPCIMAIDLGACKEFAVMAGTAASCTGSFDCDIPVGKLGAGTAITGQFAGDILSTSSNWNAADCAKDGLAAFTAGKAMAAGVNLDPELGGLTFLPGTYTHGSAISIGVLNHIVTLDGGGDENAVFIFIAGSTLTTSPLSQIVLQNGAKAGNVFWVIGTALVVGNGSIMVGTFLVGTAVTIGENAKIWGRVIAQTAVACNGCIGVEIPSITSTDCREVIVPEKPELKVSVFVYYDGDSFCLDSLPHHFISTLCL